MIPVSAGLRAASSASASKKDWKANCSMLRKVFSSTSAASSAARLPRIGLEEGNLAKNNLACADRLCS